MNEVNAEVREYGNSMAVSAEMIGTLDDESITQLAEKMFRSNMDEINEILRICGDAYIIEDFRLVDVPATDTLLRWKNIGWFGKFASPNYDKLQAHFRCRTPHQPEEITLDYINEIIKRYALQRSYLDDDEDGEY